MGTAGQSCIRALISAAPAPAIPPVSGETAVIPSQIDPPRWRFMGE